MTKRIFIITPILLTFLLLSFVTTQKSTQDIVTTHYIKRFDDFKLTLNKLATQLSNQSTKKEIQKTYLELRQHYKKWEYVVALKDPNFIKEEINPAPLPKLEENSFAANVISPRGLQVLDELIFSDELSKQEITEQIQYLSNKLKNYIPTKLYDRDVFEASRTGLIRLFTLGLTGFDTPGSINGIFDAKYTLTAMHEDVSVYQKSFDNKDSLLSKKIEELFAGSINYLNKNSNFNTFNRAHFLKTYLNPLSEILLKAHKILQLELPNEVYLSPMAYNYNSEHLFAQNFINSNYFIQVPEKFINNKTKELGRLLFYDPILSSENERSCASCHSPEKGFTDQMPKSLATGKDGSLKRNSPTLINSVYSERLFHDMRARTFVDQMEHVLTSKDEFNSDMISLLYKLNESQEYVTLFRDAFQLTETTISATYVQMALSVFVGSLSGFNSKFDQYIRNEHQHLDKSVINGFNLFMGKAVCGTCHFAPIFNGTVPPDYKESESEVLGVPENPYVKKPVIDSDEGRGQALLKEKVYFNQYAFKTPTVRNAALTFPYMHNGSYKTLNDVMDFYNKGGGKGIGIIIEHQTLPFDELKLSKSEINDIISFMNALTDTSGLTTKPKTLPKFENHPEWNKRKIGGAY